MSRGSSDCPFCGASNVFTAHRWLGSGMCRRAVAYVRCLKCGARGPMAKSEHLFDVRNERPSAQTAQDLAYRAMRMWRGEQVPGEVQPDLFNNAAPVFTGDGTDEGVQI